MEKNTQIEYNKKNVPAWHDGQMQWLDVEVVNLRRDKPIGSLGKEVVSFATPHDWKTDGLVQYSSLQAASHETTQLREGQPPTFVIVRQAN